MTLTELASVHHRIPVAHGRPATTVEQAIRERPRQAALIAAYFRHVPAEDQPSSVQDVLAVIDGHLYVGSRRTRGQALLGVVNPTQTTETGSGWADTATVINIVTDDMPHLVESVVAGLSGAGCTVHRVLHPILACLRDADGGLQNATDEQGSGWNQRVDRESWVHILIDRVADTLRLDAIAMLVTEVLADVRAIADDRAALTGAAAAAAAELRRAVSPRSAREATEAADFLYWMTAGHIRLVGYQQYNRSADGMQSTAGTGLGILRDSPAGGNGGRDPLFGLGDQTTHLLLTQSSTESPVTRNIPPFEVRARLLDADGILIREHRFLGVLTASALDSGITITPVVRQMVHTVLSALGATADSFTGQQALDLLTSYPRAELFWADPAFITNLVADVLQLSSRRRLRVFLQPDPFRRFISVMVFLPRDRYTTSRRLAMQRILLETLGGNNIRYTARVGDAVLASIHFTVDTDPEVSVSPDLSALTTALRGTIRSWEDRLITAVVGGGSDELDTAGALSRYAEAFDQSYKESYSPQDGVTDLQLLDGLGHDDDLTLRIAPAGNGRPDEWRLKLYVNRDAVTLSRALPVLHSLDAEVLEERPFSVRRGDGTTGRIYDFGLRFIGHHTRPCGDSADFRTRFTEAFAAAWHGSADADGFNALVLTAGLDWRQIQVFRAYAHYLRQIGTPHTQRYVEQVLVDHPHVAQGLTDLFATLFDPDRHFDLDEPDTARRTATDHLVHEVTDMLDQVESLDADRVLRTLLSLILATTRTNHYRIDDNGARPPVLSLKLNPAGISGIPKPVPAHEIWVYSTRMEGVHLRFGRIARGGLRWSDRLEDFRTEILGLVKAQEVKNAVIVPVGAKGGFVVKRPPLDRQQAHAEGIECYRMFIAGLLDLTDNLISGQIVPPDRVIRRDGDDPYLVVAADKGTAAFSDIANTVAADYDFWLGDAFASGGTDGYDHKAMGITARGAWESVKHHFREIDVDTQSQDFTCVGIGDMSGDVFGNGMLLSPHLHLIGAFDHRHIFLDPHPDAATSFAERQRLFRQPRSSWDDYDRTLISNGGGIWSRTVKSVTLTQQIRAALGLDERVATLTPTELIRAMLLAPVDLLWNGGLGTYIKASTESNTQVGDKANDAVRVDGNQLRSRVIGEGGNLGVTQRGRIEFARRGGRINTDAIDNSAGVDTSDHEVNIKIALEQRSDSEGLDQTDRRDLLTAMTDDVATLVLADNTAQNRVLGVARRRAAAMLPAHSRILDELADGGQLDRALENLPTEQEIAARLSAGDGLSGPELSVLLAYVKSGLTSAMLAGDLPDDPAFAGRLEEYFPALMRTAAERSFGSHPLAREIISTYTVNAMVNQAGISSAYRLSEELSANSEDAIRAHAITNGVFDLDTLWRDIAALDNSVTAECQDTLVIKSRRLLDRAARWFLIRRPQPLDVNTEIARYAEPVATLMPLLPGFLCGVEHQNADEFTEMLRVLGAPEGLAARVAYSLYGFGLLNIVDLASGTGRDLVECAELYYAVSAHLGFDRLLFAVTSLERGTRWHALARQAARDDLYQSLKLITADVLALSTPGQERSAAIDQWEHHNSARLTRARKTLGQLATQPTGDLAVVSVVAREVRSMVR